MEGFLEKGIQTPMAQGRSTKLISMIQKIRTSRLSIDISLSGHLQRMRGYPLAGIAERLVFHCRTTSASTAPRTPRRGMQDACDPSKQVPFSLTSQSGSLFAVSIHRCVTKIQNSVSLSLSLSHTHTHTHTHTNTHSLAHSHTHTRSLSLSHDRARRRTHEGMQLKKTQGRRAAQEGFDLHLWAFRGVGLAY